jgi:uncharacterized PurR-regulated membrane protein YhhQ (DUF165 family)
MSAFIAASIYALAMIAANASVAYFGPWISPLNSFVLIGLDLALRDWLHMRINRWQMAALIIASGFLTWLLNAAPPQIAIASAVSFVAAASVDWATFSALWRKPWLVRSNGSNVAGAAVDSVLFPTLAFGVLMPHIIVLQFVAKVGGGALWAWILGRRFARAA